jgi:outer membrane protein assembly factor BamB
LLTGLTTGKPTKAGKRYSYYQNKYSKVSIPCERLEATVLDFLYESFLDEPAYTKALKAALPDDGDRKKLSNEIERLEKRINPIKKQLNRLVESIEKGEATKTVNQQIEKREADQETIENKLAELQTKFELLPDPTEVMQQGEAIRNKLFNKYFQKNWRTIPVEDIRAFLELHFGPRVKDSEYGIFVTPVKPDEKIGLTVSDGKKRWRIDIRGRFDTDKLLAEHFVRNSDNVLTGKVPILWDMIFMFIYSIRSRIFDTLLFAVASLFVMPALINVATAEQWPTYLRDSARSGLTNESISLPLAEAWRYSSVHPLCPSWSESARHDFFHHHRGLREHIIFDRALHLVSDGSRVYFGSTADDSVRCVDAVSGREIWSFPTAGPVRATPTLSDGRVFFGSDDGTLRSVCAESGKLLWSIPPQSSEKMIGNGRLISRWPIRTTVVVDGDIGYYAGGLFPTSEGVFFRKFNLKDGQVISEEKLTQPAQGAPVLADDRIIVPAGHVTPTMLTKGEPDWLVDRLGRGISDTYASSGEYEPVILVGNGCKGQLDAYSKTSRKRIGQFTGFRAVISKNLVVVQSDETLQAIKRDKYFAILEKMTEIQEQCEKQKRRGKVDDKLVQELARLKKESGEQVKWTVPSQGRYALIQTADMVFAGGENRLDAFSLDNGKRLWSSEVVGRVYGLAIAEGRLFVSTSQGMIYAFEPKRVDSVAKDQQPEASKLVVHPNVLSRTTDSVEVEWSAKLGDSSYLQYGLVDNGFSDEAKGAVVNHFSVAQLDNLKQGAVYQARIVLPRDGREPLCSDRFYFRTEVDPKSLELPESLFDQRAEQSAEKILKFSSGQKGYCVVLYPDDARLAVALARTRRWQVILVCRTQKQADETRRTLNRLSLGGRYITVLHGPLETLGLPPYFADFVIGPKSEKLLASANDAYRLVRPEGGRLLLAPGTKDAPQDSKTVADPFSESSSSESSRLLSVRGPLPGSGTWKQGLGDPGQTGQSYDERVYGPMRVLWFGEPGPRRMADRHHRNPPPLYADGRLFVPGDQIVFALCAYSGTPLWQKKVPGSRRLGTFLDSSNLSLDDEHLYLAVEDRCLRINPKSGEETLVPLKLPPEDAGKRHWGYVAAIDAEDGLVLGTSVAPTAGYKEMSYDGDRRLWHDQMELVIGKSIFAHNSQDGSLRWTYRGGAIVNTTIAIGPEKVYFLESESHDALDNRLGRVQMSVFHKGDCYLTALNLDDGSVAWRKKIDPSNYYHIAYLNYTDGKLLLSGNRYVDKNLWYFFTCYDAKGGTPIWSDKHNTKFKPNGGHGEQNRHPTIVGKTAYIYPYAYDLATGKRDEDFNFNRGGHGCGNVSASKGALFYRGGNPQQRDLVNGGGTQKINTVSRPGCWINMIPAGGLLMIPEASSGCTCAYPLQTSITYIPNVEVTGKDKKPSQ